MNMKKNNTGFSLIELIIAIAILIILTGLLAPQFMKYIEKSREAKDVQAMDTVYSSLQAALANEGAYDYMVEQVDDEVVHTFKVSDFVNETTKTKLGVEIASLLGNADLILKSKLAKNGQVCFAIKYEGGKEVGVGTGSDKVFTVGGYEIMVYCGNDDEKLLKGLQTIGADLDVDEASE